jgi:hypothetical protein
MPSKISLRLLAPPHVTPLCRFIEDEMGRDGIGRDGMGRGGAGLGGAGRGDARRGAGRDDGVITCFAHAHSLSSKQPGGQASAT